MENEKPTVDFIYEKVNFTCRLDLVESVSQWGIRVKKSLTGYIEAGQEGAS